MAEPMNADTLVRILRAEGLTVVEHRSWRTHNRNHKGPWGPVNGTMLHHTVSRGDLPSVNLCYDGYAELLGPLCHGVITKDGKVYLVGNGRTNHAGGGDPTVLAQVASEEYGARPSRPQVGNTAGVDGNRRFYGFECVNMGDGKDPWPAVQVDAMVRASAAIARHYRWTEKSTISHAEWSKDKSDPAGPGMPPMPDMRAKIGERLAHPAAWSPDDTQGPNMPTKPDRQMLYRAEDVSLIPNTPYTIYWTVEGQDDGEDHGAGGKTMATNVAYNSVVSLTFTGLGSDEYLDVYPVEEDLSGVQTGAGRTAQVNGRVAGASVTRAVPIIGIVANRLCIQVVNRGSQVVTLTDAQAASQYWPNA